MTLGASVDGSLDVVPWAQRRAGRGAHGQAVGSERRVELSVAQEELSAWLMQQAPRYGMAADAFAQALVEAGQVPMAIQDIRRAKALALVLENATVVDADGNAVDLKELDEELNAAVAAQAAAQAAATEVVEVDEEIDVYTDADGNVVEVDVVEEITEVVEEK